MTAKRRAERISKTIMVRISDHLTQTLYYPSASRREVHGKGLIDIQI